MIITGETSLFNQYGSDSEDGMADLIIKRKIGEALSEAVE